MMANVERTGAAMSRDSEQTSVRDDSFMKSVFELARLYDPMGRPRLPKDQWAIVNVDANITITTDGD